MWRSWESEALRGSSKRLDHSPDALKLRPPVLKPRGRQAKTEKVRLREPLRSRSKGCQARGMHLMALGGISDWNLEKSTIRGAIGCLRQSTSTAPSAWTDSEWGSKTEWGSKSTLLSLQPLGFDFEHRKRLKMPGNECLENEDFHVIF